MLDMGFRPAIDRIVAMCPEQRQTLFFSATLDGEAGRIAHRYAHHPALHQQGPPARRANAEIEHRFVQIAHEHRVEALVHELRRDRDLTLVFVRTKRGADRLVKRLTAHGVKAVAMHGNKSQRQREQALARFESGAVDTLVATDVAARGIDVDRISHVINFDPPADSETYVHRIGRTGRAQAVGDAFTLVTPEDTQSVRDIQRFIGQKIPDLKLAGFPYKHFAASTSDIPSKPHRGHAARRGMPGKTAQNAQRGWRNYKG
jgi:superfamily II DNA/RNA helicase